VPAELHLTLSGAERDGRDLGVEAALVPGLLRAHLRAVGDLVGLLPRDAVPRCELLCRLSHREAALRVGERGPQRVLEHAAGLAQPQLAPACAAHDVRRLAHGLRAAGQEDRKSTRLNSSHVKISYAVFCLKKKKYEDILVCEPHM